jgi:hypothetical protein
MAFYKSGTEPTYTLASGAIVLQAVFDTLTAAQACGYAVTFDDDGLLSVWPDDLNENAIHILESNAIDLARILADQTGKAH